jgi:hypothetical protein
MTETKFQVGDIEWKVDPKEFKTGNVEIYDKHGKMIASLPITTERPKKTKTRWVNLYWSNSLNDITVGDVHAAESKALIWKNNVDYLKTVEVEIPVE